MFGWLMVIAANTATAELLTHDIGLQMSRQGGAGAAPTGSEAQSIS